MQPSSPLVFLRSSWIFLADASTERRLLLTSISWSSFRLAKSFGIRSRYLQCLTTKTSSLGNWSSEAFHSSMSRPCNLKYLSWENSTSSSIVFQICPWQARIDNLRISRLGKVWRIDRSSHFKHVFSKVNCVIVGGNFNTGRRVVVSVGAKYWWKLSVLRHFKNSRSGRIKTKSLDIRSPQNPS